MSISSISNMNSNLYTQLASGKRINSAADDAAGMAIAQKLESQANGYDAGTRNARMGQAMLNTAEGGLSSIADSLQRMRELSVQAANTALYTPADIQAMQDEVEQLKGTIQDAAKNTQFNTMSLLDGSKADWNMATNPNGNGMTIQTANSTLDTLGIADYDLTGDFDIGKLDDAIQKVNDARSSIGASSNALDHTINYNKYASYNLTASQSALEDLDIPKAVSEKEKNRVIEEYQIFFMKKRMEEEDNVNRLLRF